SLRMTNYERTSLGVRIATFRGMSRLDEAFARANPNPKRNSLREKNQRSHRSPARAAFRGEIVSVLSEVARGGRAPSPTRDRSYVERALSPPRELRNACGRRFFRKSSRPAAWKGSKSGARRTRPRRAHATTPE